MVRRKKHEFQPVPENERAVRFNQHTEKVTDSWSQLEAERGNQFVSIDSASLSHIATDHYLDQWQIPAWKFPEVYPENDAAFASYVLIYNAINAAFNLENGEKYSVPFVGGKELSGAVAMVRKFFEAFGENVITTKQLQDVFSTEAAVRTFFRGVNDIPYPEMRYEQFADLIARLSRSGKNPLDLLTPVLEKGPGKSFGIRAFNAPSGEGLVDLLIRCFPKAYGEDRQSISGLDFPFYKRAQLVPLLLHGRAVNSSGSVIQPIVDVDQIGPISDYEVPRSLRGLGILQVDPSLNRRIQNWEMIEKDSQEEVELRAATVVACVNLLSEINTLRGREKLPSIHMGHLDYWLWSQAKVVAKEIRPHLTKTMAY